MIRISKHPVKVDIQTLLNENMPFLHEFYTDKGELKQDASDLFKYHIDNAQALPFYELQSPAVDSIRDVSERAYTKMVEALTIAFKPENRYLLLRHFDCNMLSSTAGREFIEYAIWTFSQATLIGQSIYSRFDLAVDPDTGKVKGIYELNADTPTMLFESTALQDYLVKQHPQGAGGDAQCNEWYEYMLGELKPMISLPGANIGVVFDSNSIDDSATCEIIQQQLSEHCNAVMVDYNAMGYERLRRDRPFEAYDIVFDAIFSLIPWEEMVEKHPESIMHWKNWCTNVAFMEPAWKWFMSNKGIFSLITELGESKQLDLEGLPFLRTYLSPVRLASEGLMYVRKPKVGRMSANVSIVNSVGDALEENNGPYAGEQMVYQVYCSPGKVNPERNFIVGAWMAPASRRSKHDAVSRARLANIAIREFNSGVTNFGDEQFIPHVTV